MDNEIVEQEGMMELESGTFIFKKPYDFEGETYKTLNLRGLEELTAADMIGIDREMMRNGSTSFMNEISLEYALKLASKATKLPIEFFYQLGARETTRLKMFIMGFLFGQA